MKQDLQISEETLNSLRKMAALNLTGDGPVWTWIRLLTPIQSLNLLTHLLEKAETLELVPGQIHRLMTLLAPLIPEMTAKQQDKWIPEIQLWVTWPLTHRKPIVDGSSPPVSTGVEGPMGESTMLRAVHKAAIASLIMESENTATVGSNLPPKED